MKTIRLRCLLVTLGMVLMSSQLAVAPQTAAFAPPQNASSTQAATEPAIAVPPPLDWPVAAPTDAQIAEARLCDLKAQAAERYPTTLDADQLASSFRPVSACDWAILAVAYAARLKEGEQPMTEARQAFLRAVSMNPALAQALPMLAGYFGKLTVVKVPPFLQQPITAVKMHHTFSGIATDSVDYTLTITQANTRRPVVAGKSKQGDKVNALSGTVDSSLVQALSAALTDWMPIRAKLSLMVCYDDYPDWQVTLTFKDGSTLDLETNQSNVLFSGGPWQTVIKQQRYMQYSAAFLTAAIDIAEALNLPKDETAAMTCGGIDDTLAAAFPPEPAK